MISGTFGFPFCQPPLALTKRRDDIVVTNMIADMRVAMVADMVVFLENEKNIFGKVQRLERAIVWAVFYSLMKVT